MLSSTTQGATDTDQIRNEIIRTFLQSEGKFVSGESLSKQLGVTRTAVWKHINALEAMGFCFTSTNRLGYKLSHVPDILIEPLLKAYLNQTTQLGKTVYWLPEVDSTNLFAQSLIGRGAKHGTLVSAAAQTGGKGRRGRIWFSPETGLWMSIISQKVFPLRRAAEITLLTSIVVRR